ncbi:MAG: flagellar hook-associated protein FlgK, partial [bacterium]
MRSSFFGIETMRRALLTHQRALDVIGHNVANAATPGYTRQQVILTSTSPFSYPGTNNLFSPGQIGTGVMVEEVRRIRDVFVDNQIRIGNSQQGEVEIEKETLRRIENAFLEPATSEGLNDAMTKFFEAWQELSLRPENMAVRYTVVNTAQNLVDVFHGIDQQLRNIREDLNSQTRKVVDEINRITGEITALNQEISKVFTHGDTPNDLMDKRDLLLDELSQYVDISVEETETHGVAVYIGGRVLIRDQYRHAMTDEMTWDHPSQNSEPGFFRDVSENDFYMLSNFARGELKGLAVSRDEIVTEVQRKFTEMVQSFMNEINNAHVKGFGIDLAEDNILGNVWTRTDIMPGAGAQNVVQLNDVSKINIGDILKIEELKADPTGANATINGESVTVRVERIDSANNLIYFEMIDQLNKPDDTAGYVATPYVIGSDPATQLTTVRKIEQMNFNFFDLQTALQPQYAGDTSPEYSSRMTSTLILPTGVTLNTTMAELEALYGLNIAGPIAGTSLQLDDNATTQGITESTSLRIAFDFIIRERLQDNDGKPLDIVFDEVNRRIILSGETR